MSDLKPIATDELVNIFLRNTEYATLDELTEATDKKIMEWMHKTFPDRTVTFSIMDGVDGQGYNRIDGIELEEKYCEIARRRVAQTTPSLFRDVTV